MSRLSNLLRQVEAKEPQLAADLKREVEALSARRAFGLNFERHIPETVELPGRPVRKGDKVRFLPKRGEMPSSVDGRLWRVVRIRRTDEGRVADVVRQDDAETEPEAASRAADNLVVIAEFRDPIYPGLISTGKVQRGGDKPFHTVINAENFHALQALLYTHEGKVDAIYIDPPYNTGARDWKYNNDYVDADDAYRHSKWLAMMERRLKLAKQLLNPASSVLIVTIDENELHHLGVLLDQVFPQVRKQLVTITINPSGAMGASGMSRVEEYAFFCFAGNAQPADTSDDLLTDVDADGSETEMHGVRWERLMRGGTSWYREKRPNLCYPVLLNDERTRMIRAGEPLEGDEASRPATIEGYPVAWPVRTDGRLGIWRVESQKLNDLITKGYAQITSESNAAQPTLRYLLGGTVDRIEAGELIVTGRGDRGQVLVEFPGIRKRRAKTVWRRGRHTAGGAGGTHLLNQLLGSRDRFSFPKSLYAVEDALRLCVSSKPEAVIVDFFAGSGTTAHAVMRLNRQDGARRQCISVTNNEVATDAQKTLREAGLRPGDDEWEALGVYEYVTKPRVQAAVTGRRPDGEPVAGDYKFSNEFPMAEGFEENVEFFTMTYEAPRPVAHNRAFEAIAPLLWLKAGSQGRRIEKAKHDFDVADTYGVLLDLDASQKFLAAIAEAESVRMVFIVTDDDRGFQMMCSELPARVEAVRLYESYLTNFVINTEWE